MMKTLNEVIKAYEYCVDNKYMDCRGCPYENKEYGEAACCDDDKKDALHYLKILQAMEKRTAEQLEELKEEFRPNDPLTWSELKQMEGKPVWVEYNLHLSDKDARTRSRMWIIVQKIMPWRQDDELITVGFGKKEMGKTWQAYRKERE